MFKNLFSKYNFRRNHRVSTILFEYFFIKWIGRWTSIFRFVPKRILIKLNNSIDLFENPLLLEDITDNSRCYIVYGRTSKICLLSKDGTIIFNMSNDDFDSGVRFSLGISEIWYRLQSLFSKYSEVSCNVHIKRHVGGGEKSYQFSFPLDGQKHGAIYHDIGRNWINFYVPLPRDCVGDITVKLSLTATRNASLALRDVNSSSSPQESSGIPFSKVDFFISEPVLQKKNQSTEELVLYLSLESMTDPLLFVSEAELQHLMPNYCLLREEGLTRCLAYSTADGTLSAIGSIATCARPGTHRFGDYDLDVTEHRINLKHLNCAYNIKKQGYHTAAFTTYPRLGHQYRWYNGFDHYFNSDKPYHDDAVSSDTITSYIEHSKAKRLFIFAHLTRLHLPLISNDDKQKDFVINASSLDEALVYKNYTSLYVDSFRALDIELGKIISYLKSTKLYDNTDIILVGDHGVKMPPKWKNQIDKNFDLYEEHVRVPLVIKPRIANKIYCTDFQNPVNAHIFAEKYLEKVTCPSINQPSDIHLNFEEPCIIETIFHPDKNNYSICLVEKEFKYWVRYDFNWNCSSVIGVLGELLFKRKGNVFDENVNVIKDYPETADKFRANISAYLNGIADRNSPYGFTDA